MGLLLEVAGATADIELRAADDERLRDHAILVGRIEAFDDSGRNIVCTVVEAGPNTVTQVKTQDGSDGYDAVQLGFDERKSKRTSKALTGHFDKVGASPKRKVKEFRDFGQDVSAGDEVAVSTLFAEGEMIQVESLKYHRGTIARAKACSNAPRPTPSTA